MRDPLLTVPQSFVAHRNGSHKKAQKDKGKFFCSFCAFLWQNHAPSNRLFKTDKVRTPMNLSLLDWTVIAAYFLFNLGIGIYYARRATGRTSEVFLSGRKVARSRARPSMVATPFAADTPLAVTGFVARNGIAGNWLWWNFVMSGMLTVFLYARLSRRAGGMTDIEFAELRYSGKPAAFLRGFRALYLGLPINCIILGWVNLAVVMILEITPGLA